MKRSPAHPPLARPCGKTLAMTLALLACLGATSRAQSQYLPKTSDIGEDIASDGSVDLSFQMTFDAAPWRQWKTIVGDEPARLRAMMRHQFAAMTLENFKLDRDDMNRVARLTMHSPVGPDLRDDGTYQIPVDGYFRLVNGTGRTWYFSGNNPNAGNTLNNIKITLPANATNAYVANPNNPDQGLVFALTPPPSPARWLYAAGAALCLVGGLALLAAFAVGKRTFELLPPMPPRALPQASSAPMISQPPSGAGAAVTPAPPAGRAEPGGSPAPPPRSVSHELD